MATRFIPKTGAMTKFVRETQPQAAIFAVAKAVEEAAEEAMPKGSSLSQFRQVGGPQGHPVGPMGEPYEHGFARQSFHTRKFRGGFRVYSKDWWINVIEFGSVKNRPYAPLRRGVRAIGHGKVVETPKGAKPLGDE